jgi:hypothetical protein
MDNSDIFYGHLVYFTAIWYNLLAVRHGLLSFGIFFRFDMFGPIQIWQPWSNVQQSLPAQKLTKN